MDNKKRQYCIYAERENKLAFGCGTAILAQYPTMAPDEVYRDLSTLGDTPENLPPIHKMVGYTYPERIEIPEELDKLLRAFMRPRMPKMKEVILEIEPSGFTVTDTREGDGTVLRYTKSVDIQRAVYFDLAPILLLRPAVLFMDTVDIYKHCRIVESYLPILEDFQDIIIAPRSGA